MATAVLRRALLNGDDLVVRAPARPGRHGSATPPGSRSGTSAPLPAAAALGGRGQHVGAGDPPVAPRAHHLVDGRARARRAAGARPASAPPIRPRSAAIVADGRPTAAPSDAPSGRSARRTGSRERRSWRGRSRRARSSGIGSSTEAPMSATGVPIGHRLALGARAAPAPPRRRRTAPRRRPCRWTRRTAPRPPRSSSPSCLSQRTIVPSVTVSPSCGMVTRSTITSGLVGRSWTSPVNTSRGRDAAIAGTCRSATSLGSLR